MAGRRRQSGVAAGVAKNLAVNFDKLFRKRDRQGVPHSGYVKIEGKQHLLPRGGLDQDCGLLGAGWTDQCRPALAKERVAEQGVPRMRYVHDRDDAALVRKPAGCGVCGSSNVDGVSAAAGGGPVSFGERLAGLRAQPAGQKASALDRRVFTEFIGRVQTDLEGRVPIWLPMCRGHGRRFWYEKTNQARETLTLG